VLLSLWCGCLRSACGISGHLARISTSAGAAGAPPGMRWFYAASLHRAMLDAHSRCSVSRRIVCTPGLRRWHNIFGRRPSGVCCAAATRLMRVASFAGDGGDAACLPAPTLLSTLTRWLVAVLERRRKGRRCVRRAAALWRRCVAAACCVAFFAVCASAWREHSGVCKASSQIARLRQALLTLNPFVNEQCAGRTAAHVWRRRLCQS